MLEPIHSGHFMTSNPHRDTQGDDEDEDVEVDVVDVDDSGTSATICEKNTPDEKPVTFYKFGPMKMQSIAIDVSLNKLNKCIRVAYMKMTTPKWKDFKGLKLQWKHRIRLNNVIWRAYYMEFVKKQKRKRFCYFTVPDSDDNTHTKIEGSLLEGMYWKRRMEAVCAQYKRWRTFNRNTKKKRCCRKRENSCQCENREHPNINSNDSRPSIDSDGMMMPLIYQNNYGQQRSRTPQYSSTCDFFDIDDDFDNEFTNSLFESLNAPFLFPNPKESNGVFCGNADIMQPGLLPLQPSIEEIMSADYAFCDDLMDSMDGYSDELSQMDSRPSMISAPVSNRSISQKTPSLPPPASVSQSEIIPEVSAAQKQGIYSAKEYDAANMLVDYSNQLRPSAQQQQQNMYLIEAAAYHGLTDVMTANVPSNPLYSQAVYEPQIGGVLNPQHFQQQSQQQVLRQQQLPMLQLQHSMTSAVNQDGSFGAGVPSPLTPPLTLSVQPQKSLNYGIPNGISCSVDEASPMPIRVQQNAMTVVSHAHSNNQNWWFGPQQQQQQTNNSRLQQQQQLSQSQQQQQFQETAATLQSTSAGAAVTPSSIGIVKSRGSSVKTNRNTSSGSSSSSRNSGQQQHSTSRTSSSAASPFIKPSMPPVKLPSAPDPSSRLNGNDLARYLTQSGSAQSTSPSVSLANMLTSAGPFSEALTLAIEREGGGGCNNNNNSFVPASQNTAVISPLQLQGPPLSAPLLGSFSLAHTEVIERSPSSVLPDNFHKQASLSSATSSRPMNTSSHHNSLLPPPAKKSALTPPSKKTSKGNSNSNGSGTGSTTITSSLGKQSLELHGTSNLFITSSAGPTTTSNHLYLNSTAACLTKNTFPAGGLPFITQPSQQPQLNQILLLPTAAEALGSINQVVTTNPKSRWSVSSASAFSPTEMHHNATATTTMNFASLTDFVPTTNSAAAASALLAPASSLSQASPYSSEMTSPVRRKNGSHQPLEHSLSTEKPSPALVATPLRKTSEPTNLTPVSISQTFATVKEEHLPEEKPLAGTSNTQLLSKRRHTMSAASALALYNGSRSAPADSTLHPEERKRILHLHAEKNRRNALKEGFDCLVDAIPLVEQTGVKCTNAVVLNRAAKHIKDLKSESDHYEEQIEEMRLKIAKMNEKITLLQSTLPTSSTRNDASNSKSSMTAQVEQFFDRYRKEKSREDYRFWLMCEVMKPIVFSYANAIHPDPGAREQLLLTATRWAEKEWNSGKLRPFASETLVKVATASGAFTGEENALINWLIKTSGFTGKHK